MTDFAGMLSMLRAEGDYKNTTIVGQAKMLGVSAAEFQEWEDKELPPPEGWAEKVKEHYHLTDREFQLRLRIAAGDAIFTASEDDLLPCGLFVRHLCQEHDISLEDISMATCFGLSYINAMCFGLRPMEKSFVSDVAKSFDVPIPDYLQVAMSKKADQNFSIRNRTLKQRVVLNTCPNLILTVGVVKRRTIAEFLHSIPTDNVVETLDTPLMLYIQNKLMRGRKESLQTILSYADIPRSRIDSIRSGNRALSTEGVRRISDAMKLSSMEQEALQYMNMLSQPMTDGGRFADEATVREDKIICELFEKTPYMTDELADQMLELVWLPVNESLPAIVKGRPLERAPRYSLPKAPAMIFLYNLPGNEDLSPADIQARLGIHYTTYLRRSLGRINTSLEGYRKMCSEFNLDAIDSELLRHFCNLSRTVQPIYLADCGVEHRFMVEELQGVISLLTDNEVKQIRDILAQRTQNEKRGSIAP